MVPPGMTAKVTNLICTTDWLMTCPPASILKLLSQCRSTHCKVLRTLAGQGIRRKSRGWSLLACQLLDSFDKHEKVLVR